MNRPALLAAMADVTTVNFGETVAKEDATVSPRAARGIRLFLLFEATTFVVASLSHLGIFVSGYEHRAAGTAESVIAAVLLVGWATTWVGPAFTRGIGLAAQTFALLGTLGGLFTIAIGVGPRTVPDIAYPDSIAAVPIRVAEAAQPHVSGASRSRVA